LRPRDAAARDRAPRSDDEGRTAGPVRQRPAALLLLAVLLAAGCSHAPREVTFHAEDNPEKLSQWGLFTIGEGRIAPHRGMVTYDLAAPLFSDYAQKWRTIWMPKGVHANYRRDAAFDFPVGTIVTKTFYYTTPEGVAAPQRSGAVVKTVAATYQTGIGGLDLTRVRLIETRLLVRRAQGWVALPYVWNDRGTEATLERTGAAIPLTLGDDGGGDGAAAAAFVYSVPNQNQCAGCHATDYRDRKLLPIGLKARHMNRSFAGEGGEINQLKRLAAMGYLDGVPGQAVPRNANWQDEGEGVAARARSYLDVNCSHCHSTGGPARTSGLDLDARTADPRLLGLCKPPVAAGRGTGGRAFDVVPGHADKSILTYRMQSTDPGEMMPELGRALSHDEGIDLVITYIATLAGSCEENGGRGRIAAR